MRRYRYVRAALALAAIAAAAPAGAARAASHREAPLTALDRPADITDFYAFLSYDDPTRATLIMAVDPLLEPANGPNYFPFDDAILYAIRVDNDQDGTEDVTFEVRFTTEQRLPAVPVGIVGAGDGVAAPDNSPPPVPAGTALIPPAVVHLDGPGSEGLGLRQTYTVTMVRGAGDRAVRVPLRRAAGGRLVAVPSNVGPRTMPDYAGLAAEGIYTLERGVEVFAGTTEDAFWIDLGATFDSLNFRVIPDTDVNGAGGFGTTGIPAVLTDAQDAAAVNFVTDAVSGYNVNHIALEVPVALLARTATPLPADHPLATVGAWATTSRPRYTLRKSGSPDRNSGGFTQVQRMGHPLFNELLIGTATKDLWSRSHPRNDSQFAGFALDPLIARVANAATGGAVAIPVPPRLDLLPVVQYRAPIAAPGAAPGPIADLLRLNLGVPPTPAQARNRLGLLGGDPAGYPNGRRVSDDVTDIILRIVVGGVLTVDGGGSSLDRFPNNRLGDGVNVNDVPYQETFPYVAWAHDGVNRRHRDPGEDGGGPTNP